MAPVETEFRCKLWRASKTLRVRHNTIQSAYNTLYTTIIGNWYWAVI